MRVVFSVCLLTLFCQAQLAKVEKAEVAPVVREIAKTKKVEANGSILTAQKISTVERLETVGKGLQRATTNQIVEARAFPLMFTVSKVKQAKPIKERVAK